MTSTNDGSSGIYRSLCELGRTRIANPAAILGVLCLLFSIPSASHGKPYGIGGAIVGIVAICASGWYSISPSPLSMVSIGIGLVALVAWIIPDLLPTSSTDSAPGGMAIFGVIAFLAYAVYAFWFANKLRASRRTS